MNRYDELIELLDHARENADDDEIMILEHEMDMATGVRMTKIYNDMLQFNDEYAAWERLPNKFI
tara:strand:- start:280 stop:471 length:192 start_codon:yes stop_codon:yes gene_type:complete